MPQERLLGLPFINMLGSASGFVGSYIIGALNSKSGNFNASEWMMAGFSLVSAAAVLAFPLRWSSVVRLAQLAAAAEVAEAEMERGPATNAVTPVNKLQRSQNSSLLALMVTGEALCSCPPSMLSHFVPTPEGDAALQQVRRAATFAFVPSSGSQGRSKLPRSMTSSVV